MSKDHEMLDDRTQRQRGDKAQRADDHDDPDQPCNEERGMRWQGSTAGGNFFLLNQRACDCQRRDDEPISGKKHANAERGIVEGIVCAQSGERGTVIVGRG